MLMVRTRTIAGSPVAVPAEHSVAGWKVFVTQLSEKQSGWITFSVLRAFAVNVVERKKNKFGFSAASTGWFALLAIGRKYLKAKVLSFNLIDAFGVIIGAFSAKRADAPGCAFAWWKELEGEWKFSSALKADFGVWLWFAAPVFIWLGTFFHIFYG